MKKSAEIKVDFMIASIMSGGVFVQTANALLSMFNMPNGKSEQYLKNKIRTAIKECNALIVPLEKGLKHVDINCRPEMNKLVDMVADVASLDDAEFKRLNGILEKIKQERFEKHRKEVAA